MNQIEQLKINNLDESIASGFMGFESMTTDGNLDLLHLHSDRITQREQEKYDLRTYSNEQMYSMVV